MNKGKRVLYCCTLCSDMMLEFLFRTSKHKPVLSAQKFHRLIAEGLAGHDYNVTVLSAIPVSRDINRKIWWPPVHEVNNNIKYSYLPFLNFNFLRQIFIAASSFIKTAFWCIQSEKADSVIIYDVLNISISRASRMAARIFDLSCGTSITLPALSLPCCLDPILIVGIFNVGVS